MGEPQTPQLTPPTGEPGKRAGAESGAQSGVQSSVAPAKQSAKQSGKQATKQSGKQATKPPSDLALEEAHAAALTRLRGDGGSMTKLRKEVESALTPGWRRTIPSLAEIEAVRDDLKECTAAVAELLAAAVKAEDQAAAAAPFKEHWLSQTERLLRGALVRGGGQWRELWLSRWCEALSSSAWDAAAKVADLAVQPHAGRLRPHMVALGEALSQEEPDAAAALAAATELAQSVRDPFDVHLTLVVLAARCSIRLHDTPAALAYARQSIPPADTNPRLSNLSLAVRAEAQLAAGHLDTAGQLARRARDGKGAGCDAYVVSGVVAEAQAQTTPSLPVAVQESSAASSAASPARSGASADPHQAALDFYDLAALRFGAEAVRGHLLQPVPPALLWRVGRRLRVTEPARGLELYDRALDPGAASPGEAVERRALVERAALLKERGRGSDAAADLRRAAELYLSSRAETAVSLLQEACQLAPEQAVNHWGLAEALRVTIDRTRPRQAHRRAHEAAEHFARGFELQPEPRPEDAWALLSWASLRWLVRSAPADECAVDIERALLLDGGSQRSLAFLVSLLRDSGTPRSAWEAVPSTVRGIVSDVALAEELAVTGVDLGEYAEVLELLDDFELFYSATPTTELVRVLALLLRGDAAGALEPVEWTGSTDPRTLVVAALCHAELGQEEAAQQALRTVVERTGDDPMTRSWAEFLLGDVPGPVEAYEAILAQESSWLGDDVIPLNLAQMLVVRGAEDDLTRARSLFRQGIGGDVQATSLALLVDVELPELRTRVAGLPHAAAAGDVIDEASTAAADRITRLRTATMPEGTAANLCRARVATAEGRLEEAMARYAAVPADEVREVVLGTRAAADRLLAQGDAAVGDGDADRAETAYRALAEHAGALGELDRMVAARLALLGEERADAEGRGREVAALAATDGGMRALESALEVFARDPQTLWQHHEVLEQAAVRAPESSAALLGLAEGLPLSRAYRTGVDAFDSFAAPVPYSVEVLLPPTGHGLLDDGSALRRGIPELREVIMHELGVRIPGLRVHQQPEVPEDKALILVYGDLATTVELGEGAPGPPILDELSIVIRDNAFRWVSPDDIPLWASGWDVDSPYETTRADLPPRPTRIRLAKVLRQLLREGVPITDRDTILATFAEAVGDHASELETLTAVRRALHPATLSLAGEAAEPVDLPERLVELLSAWRPAEASEAVEPVEPPRAAVVAAREQVLTWLGENGGLGEVDGHGEADEPGESDGPGEAGRLPRSAIRVAHATTRLDLARLLGDLRPRVPVVAAEELP